MIRRYNSFQDYDVPRGPNGRGLVSDILLKGKGLIRTGKGIHCKGMHCKGKEVMEMGWRLKESGRDTFEGPIGCLRGWTTFTTKQVEEMERDQANFKCTVCANAYNPTRDGGGMAFEDLPESWKCPVCEQPKTCMRYEDPTEEGGLDENSEENDSWAECQEEFAPRSGGDEEPRRAYVEDYERLEAAPKKGSDKNPPAKERPTNRGSLGLMREIRPIR